MADGARAGKREPSTEELVSLHAPSLLRVERCSLLALAALLLVFTTCVRRPPPRLSYSLEVSSQTPRQMRIVLTLVDWAGPHLDLGGHSPTNVMQVEDLTVTTGDGQALRWDQRTETVRVAGAPVRLTTYRIRGPIPSKLSVCYRVSPGRREGDVHMGYTGRCFGYLGSDFGIVTGRDIFLLPERSESVPRIDVGFSLPEGWAAKIPWRRIAAGWVVESDRASAAEHLVAASIGFGCFRERVFFMGRTRVRLAFVEPAGGQETVERAAETFRRVIEYLDGVFRKDLGPEYLALIAPETPDGLDIVGGGWATGQGRTMIPVSTERLREFAFEWIEAYVRHQPYRTEIRRPEEFWMVDAIANYYSRCAVARAGFGDDEGVARALATGYLSAVTSQGVPRNLEGPYGTGEGDHVARESIGPFLLLLLDRELREKHAVTRGVDSIIPRFVSGRLAPSLWSILPRPSEWESFRADFVRGTVFAPVPDLFALAPTLDTPSVPGGEPVSSLTIAYTGNTDGYLENCGCKANQSGGVARRATIVDSVRSVDPEALVLDAGSSFDRPDQYQIHSVLAEKEQRLYLEMMDQMGYSAAAIGLGELSRGPRYFRELSRGLRIRFLAANVTAAGKPLGSASIHLRCRGRRIAVIGVFEPSRGGKSRLEYDKELARLQIEDPIRAIKREAEAVRPHADMVFVIGRLSPSSIRRAVQTIPGVDVVISTDPSVPRWDNVGPMADRVILKEDRAGFLGRTLVLYTHMGQYGLSIARLLLDAAGRIVGATWTDSWLTEAVPDEDRTRRAMNRFYDRIGASREAQTSVRPPLGEDPYWRDKRYAGAQACQNCHAAEFEQWKTTPHASAYKTLLDKHRHYQPVCVSCHVVGFGSTYGYRIGQPEHPLGNVQCEMCHGPGAEHVGTPSSSTIRKTVPEYVCLECHDPEHSDRFVYTEKLPRVMHDAGNEVPAH